MYRHKSALQNLTLLLSIHDEELVAAVQSVTGEDKCRDAATTHTNKEVDC